MSVSVRTNLSGFDKFEDVVRRALPKALGTTAENGAASVANQTLGRGVGPSKPGQPPNIQTGQLEKSLTGFYVGNFKARISATAPYAQYLEFGTVNMQPRPYMRPGAQRWADKGEAQRVFSDAFVLEVERRIGGRDLV